MFGTVFGISEVCLLINLHLYSTAGGGCRGVGSVWTLSGQYRLNVASSHDPFYEVITVGVLCGTLRPPAGSGVK